MKTAINNYIHRNPRAGEILLFQEISRYLSNRYKCLFIDETHQQYVDFSSSITGCIKRKELSDLWIVAFSPRQNKARMTFLQAKFKRNSTPIPIPFRFRGDYFQYDLLSNRPLINDVSKFNFPPNILSSALLESVGSFGVFYYNPSGFLDFAYSTASELNCRGRQPQCRTGDRNLYFPNLPYGHALFLNTFSEIELRSSLDANFFEKCLTSLNVGTPIENDRTILAFIRSLLLTKSKDPVINDFINYTISKDIDTVETGDLSTPRLLIINIDPIE